MLLIRWRIALAIASVAVLPVMATLYAAGDDFGSMPDANAENTAPAPTRDTKTAVTEKYGRIPLSFEPNQGQSSDNVRFISRAPGYTAFLTDREVVIAHQAVRLRDKSIFEHGRIRIDSRQSSESIRQQVTRLMLLGANPHPRIIALDEQLNRTNYFIGNDLTKWRTDIPNFGRVKYGNVYPGIDLIFYGTERQLEFDFVVAPDADPNLIRFRVNAKDGVNISPGGELIISGAANAVTLHRPTIYQLDGDTKRPIEGGFTRIGKDDIGIQLTSYDRRKTLVVDPVLSYSTYLGGNFDDYASAVTADSSGNAYILGYTASSNFPTVNGFSSTPNTTAGVLFLTKLDPTGTQLLYSTYLGGSGGEESYALSLDSSANVYIAGQAYSADFPIVGGFQTTALNPVGTAFVSRFDTTKSGAASLVYSTYLGGGGNTVCGSCNGEEAFAIAADANGKAYVTGQTDSDGSVAAFPTTAGAFQSSLGNLSGNVFFTVIDTTLTGSSSLVYSTYLGGQNGPYGDLGAGIKIDASGNAYISGYAGPGSSPGFPVTSNAYQTTENSPGSNVFITKFGPQQSGVRSLVYSSFLGGSSALGDFDRGLALDSSNNVYLTGHACSADFPTTSGAFQTTNSSACKSFVARMDLTKSGAQSLIYSTLLGGSAGEYPVGIALDNYGDAFVAGSTSSSDFPTTSGSLEPSSNASSVGYFSEINSTGTALVYSTYIGGSCGDDQPLGVALDPMGNVYLAGSTCSTDFPVSSNPYQATLSNQILNAFVMKFAGTGLPPGWLDSNINVQQPGSASYSSGVFTVKSPAAIRIGGTADGLNFAYQPLSGDGSITARIVGLQSNSFPQTGVMIRETLNSNAASVFAGDDWNCGLCFETRATSAGSTSEQQLLVSWSGLPYWVRLTRVGSVFTPYVSQDGLNWIQGTAQTISMASNVYIGIPETIGTATLDNVSVSSSAVPAPVITGLSTTTGSTGTNVVISGSGFGSPQGSSSVMLDGSPVIVTSWSNTSIAITIPSGATSGPMLVVIGPTMNESNYVVFTVESNPLPSPWLDLDMNAGLAGSASYSSGVFTVKGATTTIGGTADGMHLVYQSLSGDGSITARIAGLQGGSGPQTGIMIRENLNPNATSVFVADDWSCGLCFETRSTTGGTSSKQQILASWSGLPYWVKLTRVGNVFTPYVSPDGLNWTQGTAQTISMAANVYMGMPSTTGSTSTLSTATLDNVSVTLGTLIPSPIVSSVSPAIAPTGTSVTITGSHFGTTQGTSALQFNGTSATSVSSWTDTQIIATVPVTASRGPVTVSVNATIPSNTGVSFTVLQINALAPPAAQVGGTVSINGVGFSAVAGPPQILLNGQTYTASSWTDTSIPFLLPTGASSGSLTVTQGSGTSNSSQFTVLEPLAVASISPTIGPAGTSVTITGAGFGATQSTSTLSFYGAPSTSITSWSDTQIVAIVPTGAMSGQMYVTLAGSSVYGPAFTQTTSAIVTDSLGNSSTYTATLIGGQWNLTNAQGSGCSTCSTRGTIQNTFDSNSNMLTTTDELGHTTTNTYDSNSNVLSTSQPIGSSAATTSYTYNSFGEVLTATDPLGNVTTNTYDGNGNLLTVTSPAPASGVAASVTHFAYNSLGELTQITDPLGHVSTMTYTTSGLIATITDAQSNVTTYAYDAHGNRTSVTDAQGHVTSFAYDASDRLITITYPPAQSGGSSTTSTFTYDSRGRRTSATDQNGKTTSYAYDTADRLITVTDAASNVTSYSYDTENNLLGITDANSHTTNFTYDAFGRVTQTTFPSSFYESYAYDAIGNLISKTDRKGQTIQYVYDALNRLTQKSYPDSTSAAYTYDLASRIQQVNDPTGTYAFAYDNMGRLIGTTTNYSFLTGTTFTNAYTYDANSNRTGYTAPDGSTNTYTYDTLNRLTTLANSWAGSFNISNDAMDRRTQLTRPNGVNTNYTYDSLSRLLSVLHQNGTSTIDGATYTLDSAGNRTSTTNQLASVTSSYTYDAIDELTQVTQAANATESYTYDAAGNRLSSLAAATSSYNASNQLTSNSNATYASDANGNTTGKTDSTGATTYSWDFKNQLTSVTLPGASGTVNFKYDPFGRRIEKVSPSATSIFAYDGDGLVETVNSGGAVTAQYTLGLDIDEPLAERRSSTTSYYEEDGLGSVSSLTSAAGTIANTYTYDSFGNVTNSTGTLGNPFSYAAREFDNETGLFYYRARYYDSTTGRFLSEDPAGFSSDTLNFYDYVSNNPLVFSDPSGLFKIHGKWCGPKWTGGQKEPYIPSHDVPGYYEPPIDYVDVTCSQHDKCFSKCRGKHPCSPWGRRVCERRCDLSFEIGIIGNSFNASNGERPNIINPWSYVTALGIALDFFPPAGPNGGPEPSHPVSCPTCAKSAPPPPAVH